MSDNSYSIVSVKRLSDNEVFSVGDKTDEGVIKYFYVDDGALWLTTEEKGGRLQISEIEKLNQ